MAKLTYLPSTGVSRAEKTLTGSNRKAAPVPKKLYGSPAAIMRVK